MAGLVVSFGTAHTTPTGKAHALVAPFTQAGPGSSELACAECGTAHGGSPNCCGPGGSWEGLCDGPHARHTFQAGWAACNSGRGEERDEQLRKHFGPHKAPSKEELCPDHPHILRSSLSCKSKTKHDEAKSEETTDAPSPAHCARCSQDGWNCCGDGGSWDRLCPLRHSWEEGYEACAEQRDAWWEVEHQKMNADNTSYITSAWSNAEKLNRLFKHGKPSNDLRESGLLVHGFDGTSDPKMAWMPCTKGFCNNAVKWWSGSIINFNLRAAFADAAFILSPSQNSLMCSYPSDAGTLSSGCGNKGSGYFAPNRTEEMLQGHTRRGGSGYNEVIINMKQYVKNLPKSVAGIVYGLMGERSQPMDKVRAYRIYVQMLNRFNLSEADFPLLKANYSTTPPWQNSPIHGPAFVDEGLLARDFLNSTEAKQVQHRWNRKHADLKDNPELFHKWLRKRNKDEQKRNQAEQAHALSDALRDVSSTS